LDTKKYILPIYNTVTGKIEDIEVNEEVYNSYRRSGWQIAHNDRRFYKQEIQFSGLIGGGDGNYENFHEFRSDENPASKIYSDVLTVDLIKAIAALSDEDKALIGALFFDEKTQRKYAEETGDTLARIHRRKKRVLAMLRKDLDKHS